MAGLQKILKMYGEIIVKGEHGRIAVWLWDYANDKPRLKSAMTKEEIAASEKAKWESVKQSIINQ